MNWPVSSLSSSLSDKVSNKKSMEYKISNVISQVADVMALFCVLESQNWYGEKTSRAQ